MLSSDVFLSGNGKKQYKAEREQNKEHVETSASCSCNFGNQWKLVGMTKIEKQSKIILTKSGTGKKAVEET